MLKDPVTVKEFFRGILLIASTLSREKTVSPLRHEVGGGGSTGNRPQARTAFFRTAGATVWPVWKVDGYLRPCRDPVLRAYRPQAKTMQSRYTDGFLRGIDGALGPNCLERPQSVAEWRSSLGLGNRDRGVRLIRPRHGIRSNHHHAEAGARPAPANGVGGFTCGWPVYSPEPGSRRPVACRRSEPPRFVRWRVAVLQARRLVGDPLLGVLFLVVVAGIMALLASWLWVRPKGDRATSRLGPEPPPTPIAQDPRACCQSPVERG